MTPLVSEEQEGNLRKLLDGLSASKRIILLLSDDFAHDEWFAAADLGVRKPAMVGSLLMLMARKGLFEQRSDPKVWGRSQYRITPVGVALRVNVGRVK